MPDERTFTTEIGGKEFSVSRQYAIGHRNDVEINPRRARFLSAERGL
jgi:hypothetical protein